MSRTDLANRYRPELFEEVWGQEHAVRYLSGLIMRGQIGRNLLLHGTVGSGKTSLVRLYAKALNCLAPRENGSPCGECACCAEPDRKRVGFHEYDVSGRGGDKQSIREWVKPLNRTPSDYKFQTLFLDEAHSLTNEAADSLLKVVEEPAERVIFCFATTEHARIRPALRSRLRPLEVRPLPAHVAIEFLQNTAEKEGIAYENEALALLAGLTHGYPRDLLGGLKQVSDSGLRRSVTVEQVRAAFDVDHTGVLVEYFMALAEGDFTRQTELIFGWRELAVDKVRWTQAFLTSLYYNDVLGIPVTIDALVHSIKSERAPILDRFCERLGLRARGDLAPYWRAMMEFWLPPMADETATLLRLTRFHHFVNDELPRLDSGDEGSPRSDHEASTETSFRASQFPGPEKIKTEHSTQCRAMPWRGPSYLRAEDARELINRASFFVQQYGMLFNASFEVRPPRFGVDAETAGLELISDFCGELEQNVRASSDETGGPFAYLTLFERDPEGIRGLVVAHLPRSMRNGRSAGIDCITRTADWQRQWRSELRRGQATKAVQFHASPTGGREALRFHWDRVLDLCAGLSEWEQEWDPARQVQRPLLELLGIPRPKWRPAGPIHGPLFIASQRLEPQAIAEASRNRMEALSAFDARAWEWLRKGWERDEYLDRLVTRGERELELKELQQVHGADTPEGRAALDRHMQAWPVKPEHRKRRWQGWWTRRRAKHDA